MGREKHRIVQCDELQPARSLTMTRYRATWREGALVAYANLEALQDQPARGYTLECNYHTVTGREPTERQIDAGTTLTGRVRSYMLEEMRRAGWREIGQDDQRRPIWQHSSRIAASSASSAGDQAAPVEDGLTRAARRLDQDIAEHKAARDSSKSPDQVSVTMDDFTFVPGARAHSYRAVAVRGDVQAILEFWPYYGGQPGAYILQDGIDRFPWTGDLLTGEQSERANALLPDLLDQVHTALQRAGWSFLEKPAGTQIKEIWLRPGERSAPASSASKNRATRPAAATRTRHKKREDQAAPVAREKQKTLYVPAHDKTRDYRRTITASDVTYTCVGKPESPGCGREVTKSLFPGAAPLYCDDCALKVRREKTRERVQRLRAGKKHAS